MKLLSTIAAVLISISAFSQDLIEYNEGTFTQNGEELSMQQIDDLTLLHKAGRGNFRRGNRFDRMHKNGDLRDANNGLTFWEVLQLVSPEDLVLVGGIYTYRWEYFIRTSVVGATTGLCVVSYKAFSRITLSREGCLRRRDNQFNKVAMISIEYKLSRLQTNKQALCSSYWLD